MFDHFSHIWLNRDPFYDTGFQSFITGNPRYNGRIDYGVLYTFVDNDPLINFDALGLVTFNGCTKEQQDSVNDALNKGCDDAKKCAGKCKQSEKAQNGLKKLCDGPEPYTVNCISDSSSECVGLCGQASKDGNSADMCSSATDSKGKCGVPGKGPGCILFHEAMHSGGLTHGENQKDFDKMAKCMHCTIR